MKKIFTTTKYYPLVNTSFFFVRVNHHNYIIVIVSNHYLN